MRPRLFRALLKLFAREVVTAAYTGLLRRVPNASELAAATAELKRTGDLEALLDRLSRSDELWKRLLVEHSDELVKTVFRGVLGREPDAEGLRAYTQLIAEQVDVEPVLFAVAGSPEHRRRLLGTDSGVDAIQTEASDEELDQCIAKVTETWAALGAARPHFSVLTDARFAPENVQQNMEMFWSTADEEGAWISQVLHQHGYGDPSNRKCVEYGCGVGRVTMALARKFAQVDAYDISAAHLALAKERAAELALSNVRFHQRTTALAPLERCDFFYSKIVFQHNPPPLMGQLIRLSLRALLPGGIALFQLPVDCPGYRFALSGWLRKSSAEDMEMHCFPLDRVLQIVGEENCETLEVRPDDSSGAPYVSKFFVVRKKP